jgi:hypothetical protein
LYLFWLERVILTHACTVAGPMCVTCHKGLGGEEKQHNPALSGTMHPKAALDSGCWGISKEAAEEAVRTAKEAGNVTTKIGRYGQEQSVYRGSNGITVVVQNEGRNAGSVITGWFHWTTDWGQRAPG